MFEKLIALIGEIYGNGEVPLHAPVLDQSDREGVLEAIDSGFVSTVGLHVKKFEEDLAVYTGAKEVVAVVNGTAALHLGLIAAGVKRDDLVISQALTFVATANAIKYIGADPVFIDSDRDTLGLSPSSLSAFLESEAKMINGKAVHMKTGRTISACVPMHVFGHLVRIEEILEICNRWNIFVVEDAAEALGTWQGKQHAGTFASIGTLSFNGNKVITTGGGGALLFQDRELASHVRHLSTTAKRAHRWEFFHDDIGFNYRLPNLNAALGCAQLKRLPSFLQVKLEIASKYKIFFDAYQSEVEFLAARQGVSPNWWLNAVLLPTREVRDQWLEGLNKNKIMARPIWELMCNLPMFVDCPRDSLSNARDIASRLINLPSGVPQ